jgi:hypothetical protein
VIRTNDKEPSPQRIAQYKLVICLSSFDTELDRTLTEFLSPVICPFNIISSSLVVLVIVFIGTFARLQKTTTAIS